MKIHLRHSGPALFSFVGPSTTHCNYIFMSSSCMNQIKNTQTFRAPPDDVINLVLWDQRVSCMVIPSSFEGSEVSLGGKGKVVWHTPGGIEPRPTTQTALMVPTDSPIPL